MAPRISSFTANGSTSTKASSHGTVTLEWVVQGASEVTIVKNGPGPAVTGIRSPNPAPSAVSRQQVELDFNVWKDGPLATTTYTLIASSPDGTNAKAAVHVTSLLSARNNALLELQETVLKRYGDIDVDAFKADSFRRDDGRSTPKYRFTHMNFSAGVVRGVLLGSIGGAIAAGASRGAISGPLGAVVGGVVGGVVGATTAKNLCFRHNGIPFAKQDDIDLLEQEERDQRAQNQPLDLKDPSMLFFNRKSRLIGCGYFRHHLNDPAEFGRDLHLYPGEWFFHVEGTHTADGGFRPGHGGIGKFHVTAWDVHVYFNTDRKNRVLGVPLVGTTSRRSDLERSENIPLETAEKIVGRRFCKDGESTSGLYVYPDDRL